MKYSPTLLLLLFVLFQGCAETTTDESETDSVKDEEVSALRDMERKVMEIHDEVMPKMSGLNNMTKKLEEIAEASTDTQIKSEIQTAIVNMSAADSLMWDWMHNYKRPDYDGDLDSARAYLESELVRVETMKMAMISSMMEGGLILDKLNNDEN